MLSAAAYPAVAECSAFYRDTEQSTAMGSLYRVGTLFREPTFCDATYQFGGFAAPHRYLILSASARCGDAISRIARANTRLWLDRLVFPLGVDDGGHFFEAWSYGA